MATTDSKDLTTIRNWRDAIVKGGEKTTVYLVLDHGMTLRDVIKPYIAKGWVDQKVMHAIPVGEGRVGAFIQMKRTPETIEFAAIIEATTSQDEATAKKGFRDLAAFIRSRKIDFTQGRPSKT